MSDCVLETVSGRYVDIINPDPATIDIDDILWVMSRLPRFNGHTITLKPYLLAQHSMFVANYIENSPGVKSLDVHTRQTRQELLLKALLHDAAEVFLTDLPSPVKRHPALYPVFKEMESKLENAIFDSLKIPRMTEQDKFIIKKADLIAQKAEAYNFMVSRGSTWGSVSDIMLTRQELQSCETPMDSFEAYQNIKQKFEEYMLEYHIILEGHTE